MQHARNSARRRPHREPNPLVRRIEFGSQAAIFVCTWIYVGLLVVDGERMVGLLTWPFAGLIVAILVFRVVAVRVLRRRSRGARARS